MFFMMPRFMTIFSGFGVDLPLPTKLLMGFSNFLLGYWWLIALLVIVAVIMFKRFSSSEKGARKLDELRLKLPVVGKVVKLNLFGQFARTLGTLLQNGVPVLTALKITEQVLPNRIVKEAIAKTREAVTDGKTLAQPQLGLPPLGVKTMAGKTVLREDRTNVAVELDFAPAHGAESGRKPSVPNENTIPFEGPSTQEDGTFTGRGAESRK